MRKFSPIKRSGRSYRHDTQIFSTPPRRRPLRLRRGVRAGISVEELAALEQITADASGADASGVQSASGANRKVAGFDISAILAALDAEDDCTPMAAEVCDTPAAKRGWMPPVLRRVLLTASGMIGVFLLSIVLLVFGATTIASYGPSPAARDLFVSTVMETSAAKFLAHMYFDDAQIQTILAGNTAKAAPVTTDAGAITIAAQGEELEKDGITVEDVRGKTFVGKMMIVNDPSRIFVKTLPAFDAYGEGMELADMIKESDAVAGINAGGFLDPNGMGRGGMPMGVVIQDGKLICETETKYPTIIGFDADHKLIAGNFSAQEALNRGIQEAVSFGPVLVSGGKVMPLSGGLNPRTAIGQRADGAVLLLVVDGRQPHSLGATHGDLAKLMVQYGAVNAANLDGGSSSLMIHEGEVLNAYSMLTGPRKLPTAFLVKRSEAKQDAD